VRWACSGVPTAFRRLSSVLRNRNTKSLMVLPSSSLQPFDVPPGRCWTTFFVARRGS
jgi:hypothetical protein